MTEPVTGSVKLLDPVGLHARPAVKMAKLAKRFEASIEITAEQDGRWVNAKSTNSLMKMKAQSGADLHIRATGEDADHAVAQLIALIERNFDAG